MTDLCGMCIAGEWAGQWASHVQPVAFHRARVCGTGERAGVSGYETQYYYYYDDDLIIIIMSFILSPSPSLFSIIIAMLRSFS